MTDDLAKELSKLVDKEAADIAAAPRVESSGNVGRCYFCGALTRDLRYVETVNGLDRYKGGECCGG